MPKINLLTQETIDKIAAGEVVERPSSVVKELTENAIDAGATAITIEIKEGGISFIRITDNGCGIAMEDIRTAFLRHSTSKITSVEDLLSVRSLGFRGEALSSIAAVARVEMITKTYDQLMGCRYVIEGSKEQTLEEVGAPDGTTFLVRDLFYNTPARRKFLKTAHTEGAYVADLVERLALSHPDISFKFINNNQTKLHTSGNGNTKDLIYHIYGREIAAALLPITHSCEAFTLPGFLGKPSVTRGNRNFESYFINGRYVKSNLIAKAIEEAYKKFIMQHQYPFTVLYFTFDSALLDVNVHPSKMELRFERQQEIYTQLVEAIYAVLSGRELIPHVPVTEEKGGGPQRTYEENIPEPFEQRRLNDVHAQIPQEQRTTRGSVANSGNGHASTHGSQHYSGTGHVSSHDIPATKATSSTQPSADSVHTHPTGEYPESRQLGHGVSENAQAYKASTHPMDENGIVNLMQPGTHTSSKDGKFGIEPSDNRIQQGNISLSGNKTTAEPKREDVLSYDSTTQDQVTLGDLSPDFLSHQAKQKHRIIGQVFDTYWLVEYEDALYIIDQHAAHEKVMYERFMARLARKEFTSQMISPPIILTLDARETEMLEAHREQIEQFGYTVEPFGGKEYMISAVPDNLYQIDMKDLFIEMLDDFTTLGGKETPQLILEKIATMSCKAAVKGNNRLSLQEADALITELLTLDNPYNCPHGRPTIIAMTKQDLDKKFKRII